MQRWSRRRRSDSGAWMYSQCEVGGTGGEVWVLGECRWIFGVIGKWKRGYLRGVGDAFV